MYQEEEYQRINRDAAMVLSKYVTVWLFHDAPEWIQAMSQHGGDEECAVWVPRLLQTHDGTYPRQIEALWLPYRGADFYQFNNGLLVIWSH